MNVIAVIGSPHKDGPSARLTLAAVQGAVDDAKLTDADQLAKIKEIFG